MNSKSKSVVLMLAGLGFGCASYLSFSHTKQLIANGMQVEATVTKVEYRSGGSQSKSGSYYPVFQFKFRNTDYTVRSNKGSNPNPYQVGEVAELIINPQQPTEFLAPDFMSRWGLAFGLAIMSLGFLHTGKKRYSSASSKESKKAWLAKNGKIVTANVVSVTCDTTTQVNGVSPYRITAQWQDPASNLVHIFRSDKIWFDPSEFVAETIEVNVDLKNPKIHKVLFKKLSKVA